MLTSKTTTALPKWYPFHPRVLRRYPLLRCTRLGISACEGGREGSYR
jgi:hypothetical protein